MTQLNATVFSSVIVATVFMLGTAVVIASMSGSAFVQGPILYITTPVHSTILEAPPIFMHNA